MGSGFLPTTKIIKPLQYKEQISCSEVYLIYNKKKDAKKNSHLRHREAKFKRALRSHFLTHFTKNFCRFLTPKVKSGTDMISPSIESCHFLFWHKKILNWIFENFVENRQSTFHKLKFSVCLHTQTHPKFQNMKFSLSVFDKIFKNPIQNFFNDKIENQS